MSDNLRRYCAIHSALLQLYPSEPTGNLARHLKTLAALVCGIIGSKKTHLPAIASKVPDGNKRESRAKRFARFLQNKNVTPEDFFVPYAQALMESLPAEPLVLVMDGSQVGRGCMALMVSVLYQQGKLKRALPLCWQVVKAQKATFPRSSIGNCWRRPNRWFHPGARSFSWATASLTAATCWQTSLRLAGITPIKPYVCRTAKNVLLAESDWPDETFSLSHLMTDGDLQPGDSVEMTDLLFTAQGFGPVLVGAVWERGQKEPLLLVTSLDFLAEARFWYKTGTRSVSASKPSFPTRRAGAFTCATVI